MNVTEVVTEAVRKLKWMVEAPGLWLIVDVERVGGKRCVLLEIGIADAYGLGYEYAPENLPKNDLDGYIQHPRYNLKPGTYSDDCQMSIAVVETILSAKNIGDITPLAFANKFVECFKRDPRGAYARGFQAFLESAKDGADFLARIKPDSDKSGAAMRAVPIGIFEDLNTMLYISDMQAKVTHNEDEVSSKNFSETTKCTGYNQKAKMITIKSPLIVQSDDDIYGANGFASMTVIIVVAMYVKVFEHGRSYLRYSRYFLPTKQRRWPRCVVV